MGGAQRARLLPSSVRSVLRRGLVRYRTLGMRADDALLVSYPKSGMTWLRFLLAQALTGEETDFDAVRLSIPPMGKHRSSLAILPSGGRLIRSHEPVTKNRARPGQPVVYLVRDGRDVALSYLAHERRHQRYDGDVGGFLEIFLRGKVDGYGPWHEHVLDGLAAAQRGDGPFLVMHYEQLRAEPASELARVLEFLGAPRDPADLQAVVEANSKDRMRAKEATSEFLATQHTDGSTFVRADRSSDWVRDVPLGDRLRFEVVCGPALNAAGYEVARTH